MNKVKFVVVFTVLLNVISMGIIIPVLPHYVESFGASPFEITTLFAAFSFFSFLSSPFLGSLSDRIGRRPILLISILSTAIGWLVFVLANNVIWLFIGRIIDGMAAGNISTAQSALVDIAKDDKERTHNLGLIGSAFGVGFIVGPLIGGLFSSFSPVVPFWVATILAFIDVLFAFFFLEETLDKKNKQLPKLEINPITPILRATKNKTLIPSFWAWLFFNLAVTSIFSVFALYLEDSFGLGPFAAGMIFTGMGIIIALNQMVGFKHFWLKYFSEPKIEFWMILITGLAFLIMGIKLFALFLIGMIANSFGQSVLRIVMTSQMVGKTPAHSRGEILGIISSIQSIGMTIAPVVAGALYTLKPNSPFIIAGLYMLVAFAIIFFNRRRIARLKLAEDVPVYPD